MMPRPMVLVFLLLILMITSQFEWRQQLVDDLDSSPTTSERQHPTNKEEVVKDKIILLQEKYIQRLNRLVQKLQWQLLQCQGINNTANMSGDSLITNLDKIEGHHSL
uniref:Laminin subunit gamma-1 n=1 Tax=Anthurium amnicola TaxID=1678845 RepID=A0A1D1YND4_9ARAE